ncbi:MAG TPA: hypothetical protein PKD47_04495, partial [Solirubrobacterales bacterium]|nr:hypothetical protein [Solirubrobacterales bacterium]
MAPTTAAPAATAAPSKKDIERASEFARESLLLNGDGPDSLIPGTARRRAFDQAIAELDAGLTEPSVEWRRNFSLLLGLERLIGEEPPTLKDGAELNPHQIDALSGTLTELLAEQQVSAVDDIETLEVLEEEGDTPLRDESEAEAEPSGEDDEPEDGDEADEVIDEAVDDDEEPLDWEDKADEDSGDEEEVGEAADDPGAARRFWFEHATGAGKTVAAVGFIEATRTGGVLILTH